MSVIPSAGIVRKHYTEASQDIEYKSSAFWQVWLQRAFYESDIYAVTSESSPDGSLRRVDLVVKRYDPDHDTLSALLWTECKRPTGSIRQVERQALDAALRCMERDNLIWIYVMTTVGVSFRTWFVEHGREELIPFHGTSVEADRAQYIDADSEDAWVLNRTVEFVKDQTPLRQAPTVPSQQLPTHPMYDFSGEEYGQGSAQETYNTGPQGQPMEEQPGRAEDFYNEEAEESTARMYGNTASQIQKTYKEVKVEKITHLTRPAEYVFTDSRGHKKSTGKDEWKAEMYNNERVWVFHGRKTSYYSRKKVA